LAHSLLADLDADAGRVQQAAAGYRQALAIVEVLAGQNPESVLYQQHAQSYRQKLAETWPRGPVAVRVCSGCAVMTAL
jgi:hypothetical protein